MAAVINGVAYLTPDEVRRKLQISRATYNRWITAGKLKPYSFEGSDKRYFLETDLSAALKEVKVNTSDQEQKAAASNS
jgi:predicted site-specific integrase-resolvase